MNRPFFPVSIGCDENRAIFMGRPARPRKKSMLSCLLNAITHIDNTNPVDIFDSAVGAVVAAGPIRALALVPYGIVRLAVVHKLRFANGNTRVTW